MKMAAINGSSVVSSHLISPTAAWCPRIAPVTRVTPARAAIIQEVRQEVKPYTSARLIQMRWNGTVSWPGTRYMSAALTVAKATHPTTSRRLVKDERIADMANRLYPGRAVEFAA